MSENFWLNWAILSVSLFNVVLLCWLGLTVLLNAQSRSWGIWLAGGGLLAGGSFFVSHTAIVGQGLRTVSQGMNFWWYLGWIPVLALPFAWYSVMLWYAGFRRWQNLKLPRYRYQRAWLSLNLLIVLALVGLFSFANPLPSYAQVARLDLSSTAAIGGIPLLVLIYPFYSVLAIGLSLEVLRRPAPSERVMGDLARRRARPWLVATSLVLLVVSLLVAWVMFWIVLNARQRSLFNLYNEMETIIAWFDLVICLLIALTGLLLGQAVIAYEIFTGKSLPRRGLRWQWYGVVMVATGYSTLIGWNLNGQQRGIYSLLITTLGLVGFYAFFSWRTYLERERYIGQLRPFVASQRLYQYLLTPTSATSGALPASPLVDTHRLFQTLCRDILGTRLAYLVALGPLSPLVGPALCYPAKAEVIQLPASGELIGQFSSPATIYVPLDPTQYGGAMWAVPLWSERGLIGVFLLGEKPDGSLYTQEEIEIARASGERLIDTQASAEMAQRLMNLQRQRLVESQVLDRRTRQVLHDEVLPILHTAMLTISPTQNSSTEILNLLSEAHHQIANLLRDLPPTAAPKVAQLGLTGALKQLFDDEMGQAFDEVNWQIEPEAEQQTRNIPSLAAEVLYYACREIIRNAARYARQPNRPLQLQISLKWPKGLEISIQDNGPGLAMANTDSPGSSGQGLALHSTLVAVVGGSLVTESLPGHYTKVSLNLPSNL